MIVNLVGACIRNRPFGTEIAFAKGLQIIGVTVNEIDPSYDNQVFDYDADATIVMKHIERPDYLLEVLRCQSGPRILFQPDDYRFPHIREMVREMRPYCDSILTFDAEGAFQAQRDFGFKRAEMMLVTADPDCYSPIPYDESKKDLDFVFVGSYTFGHNHASRRRMCDVLSNAGARVAVMTDVYDVKQLSETYARARVVLNHATDVGQEFGTGYGYQCRHFEAGMVGSCLLSNIVLDDDKMSGPQSFVRFHDEQSLLEKAHELLHSPALRKSYADALRYEIRIGHSPYHRGLQLKKFIEECRRAS